VEVGEEDEALVQTRVLLRQRLLHLQQELGLAPDLLDGCERGADRAVGVVREGAALAGARLDDHVVPALNKLPRARGRQRDAVLVGLDLLDDSDLHGGEKP
jgi:hypothetical protein